MGSKVEYDQAKDARKRARDEVIARDTQEKQDGMELLKSGFDIADRIATACERIADALEASNKAKGIG